MTTFHEREQAFEAKFAHDEEFRFLVMARRDKLFARWAAVQLQSSAQATADLTESVLAMRGGKDHDANLLKHMAKSFSEHDSTVSEGKLAAALHSCAVEARQQLLDRPLS